MTEHMDSPLRYIVVGVDGSKASDLALEWAIGEARLRGCRLLVVHAWHQTMGYGTQFIGTTLPTEVFENNAERLLDDCLEAAAATDFDFIDRAVVPSTPARALIELGRTAEMIVVGCRGVGGFRELLLGSVSHEVANHAEVPVVVVREAA